MLEKITISGLGPHRDFSTELNPVGQTLVMGPSEAGKTFLLEAITFCLWGRTRGGKFRPEAIHEGMGKATVEIQLDSGRVIERSFTQSKTQRRTITIGDETQSFTSETAFAEALGDLGRDVDALMLVVSPFEWVPMVEGNAREFRDLLARLLPEGNVGAEVERVMVEKGHTLMPGEADQSEKAVMALRSAARKTKDEIAGRLAAAEERLASLMGTEPARPASSEDGTLLKAALAWAEYDALSSGGGADVRHAELRAWDERMAALGEEPPWDPSYDRAEMRLQTAQIAVTQATAAYQQAYGQHQTAASQLQQFQGVDPSVCPTCQRPDWEAGRQYALQLQQYQASLLTIFEEATAAWQAANQELEEATAFVNAAREAEQRRQYWQQERARLGSRPVLPPLPDGAPTPPELPRPDPERLARAQASMQGAAAAEGAHARWRTEVQDAQSTLANETVRLAEATTVFDRLTDLLDAVRAAPSAVAARQALSLGDLGPVSFEFGENPAVSVNIDGRPWWLASRGRQVVADMYLRGALRRVLDKEWLPIVVDNVQDVAGQPLPELEGPVILLQTADGKGIRVQRK